MTTEEKQHSHIGPSSCTRWRNCPGSIKLIEQCESQGSTVYAAEGSVAHMVADFHLRRQEMTDSTFLGKVINHEGFDIEVTEEMLEAVDVYLKTIYDDMARWGVSEIASETKVKFSLIDDDAWGTADGFLIVPMYALVVYDYKHGAGVVVSAEGNEQARCYARGVYYSLSAAERDSISYVETVIVQPRAYTSDGSTVRRERITIEELLDWGEALDVDIKNTYVDDTLRAGSHCRFCDAKVICPEAKNEIARVAMVDFEDFEITRPLPPPSELTPEQIALVLKSSEMIKEWCASVAVYAKAAAEAGKKIPGYKLAEGRSNRRWISEDAVWDWAYEKGIDVDDMEVTKIKSPAQIEKIKGVQPEDIAHLWEKPPAKKTLVPVDNPKPGLRPSAIADFDTIDV